MGFPGGSAGKEPTMQETQAPSLGWEDPLEEERQPTPVFLPGESPWKEEPGGLQSIGSQESERTDTTEHTSTGTFLGSPCLNFQPGACSVVRCFLPFYNTVFSF